MYKVEIIEKAVKDPEAFGEIFDEYYQPIFSYVLRRVADIETARDIVSEVFLKALKNIWRFRWRNIPFSAWIYRIALNEVRMYYRKRTYRPLSLDSIMPEIEQKMMKDADVEKEYREAVERLDMHSDFIRLQKMIAKLPLKYQEALNLRYFEKMSIREISEILGKKEGTIRSLISRGKVKLKNQVNGERNDSTK